MGPGPEGHGRRSSDSDRVTPGWEGRERSLDDLQKLPLHHSRKEHRHIHAEAAVFSAMAECPAEKVAKAQENTVAAFKGFKRLVPLPQQHHPRGTRDTRHQTFLILHQIQEARLDWRRSTQGEGQIVA